MGSTSENGGGPLFRLHLIICTIAFILTLPVALTLCIPLAIYRKLVEISAKIFEPDLARIVPPTQQIIFHDDLHQQDQVAFNIVAWHALEGPLELENLRKLVQENLINRLGPNGGLEFPEFRQYCTFYGGYAFFKWDRTFDISNHVRYLNKAEDGSIVTETDLQKIISRLMSKGWRKGTSPWEILVVKNYRSDSNDKRDKSLFIFRFHHSLADGYSYLNLMVRRICNGDNPVSAISPIRKFTKWEQMRFFVTSKVRQPYDLIKMFRTVHEESSAWNPRTKSLSKEYTVVWSKPIPLDTIKKIKSTYGVSFQSVVNSIVGGTIQSLMTRADQRVPQIMNTFIAFPAGNHPGGLCVHTHFSIVKVPIADKDPVRRLNKAEKFWMEAVHSTARWLMHKIYKTVGWLPWTVGDKIMHTDFINIAISSFPGIQGDILLDNKQKVLEVNFAVGTERDNVAAVFTTLSCFGVLRFVMIVDKSVYPDEGVGEYFDEYIQKEIHSLIDPKKLSQVVAAPFG